VPSSIHNLVPRVALAAGAMIPVALLAGYLRLTRTYQVGPMGDVLAVAEGRWAWTGSDSACRTDPHTISFTPDRREMTLTHAHAFRGMDGTMDSVTRYEILMVSRDRIRGVIPGETRLTRDSVPVVWELVLRSRDRYAWHRTDWPGWAFTREIARCPEPAAAPAAAAAH
jgi:hypothetical protein